MKTGWNDPEPGSRVMLWTMVAALVVITAVVGCALGALDF